MAQFVIRPSAHCIEGDGYSAVVGAGLSIRMSTVEPTRGRLTCSKRMQERRDIVEIYGSGKLTRIDRYYMYEPSHYSLCGDGGRAASEVK